MKRLKLLPLLLLPALAACSFMPLRLPVRDFTIPTATSFNTVCYIEVSQQLPVRFSLVAYEANATYRSDLPILPQPVTMRVYGRRTPPATPCVSAGLDDVPLSDAFVLTLNSPQRVTVGGTGFSGAFSELVTSPRYYFGISLSGGGLLSINERVEFRQGEFVFSF